MRKPSHGKRNSVPDDIPIRLVVTFAVQSLHPSPGVWLQISQARRPNASDSLFVMAKHGQLLKHSFDSVLDQSGFQNNFCLKCNICHPPAIAKDKVCPRSLSEPSCRRYLKANVMYYSIPKKLTNLLQPVRSVCERYYMYVKGTTCMWKVTTRTQQSEPMQMPGLTFADEMLLLKGIQLETTFFIKLSFWYLSFVFLYCKTLPVHLPEADCTIFTLLSVVVGCHHVLSPLILPP